jgi:hypothetical protein
MSGGREEMKEFVPRSLEEEDTHNRLCVKARFSGFAVLSHVFAHHLHGGLDERMVPYGRNRS